MLVTFLISAIKCQARSCLPEEGSVLALAWGSGLWRRKGRSSGLLAFIASSFVSRTGSRDGTGRAWLCCKHEGSYPQIPTHQSSHSLPKLYHQQWEKIIPNLYNKTKSVRQWKGKVNISQQCLENIKISNRFFHNLSWEFDIVSIILKAP